MGSGALSTLLVQFIFGYALSRADTNLLVTVDHYPAIHCRNHHANCTLYICDDLTIEGTRYHGILQYSSESSQSAPTLNFVSEQQLGPVWRNFQIRSESNELLYTSSQPTIDKTNFLANETIAGVNSLNRYNSLNYSSLRTQLANSCNDTAITLLINTEQRLISSAQQQIQRAGYVVLVEEMNGLLSNQIIPRYLLPPQACHGADDVYYLNPANYTQQSNARFVEPSRATPISITQLNKIMARARSRNDIAYDFLEDGCFARSHLIAHQLSTEGIYVEKIWVTGPGLGSPFGTPWDFHTAPVVYVRLDNGSVERRVLDPAVSPEPLSVSDWLTRITGQTNPPYTAVGWPPQRIPSANVLLVSYSPHYVHRREDSFSSVSAEQKEQRLQDATHWNEEHIPSH